MPPTPKSTWKWDIDYKGHYKISSTGIVKSIDRTVKVIKLGKIEYRFYKGRIRKPQLNPYGYLVVKLSKNGKTRIKSIHRMMLEAFVSPCPEGREGCHRNDIKTDNRLENLYWGTDKQNGKDRIINGKLSVNKLNRIQEARLKGETLKQIAKDLKISRLRLKREMNRKVFNTKAFRIEFRESKNIRQMARRKRKNDRKFNKVDAA